MARIMIVDDEKDILDIVSRMLRRREHAVTVAHNGQEALTLLQQQQHPDVIVLDIKMPHVNGIEVCRHIRSNPALASIPILFLTAKERIEDKVAGFEAGADDYLTKPFSLEELDLRIRALLRYTGYIAPTGPLTVGPISIDPNTAGCKVDRKSVELTAVEFELLYYFVAHVGEVLAPERLLQDVWGYPVGNGSPSLVRMHVLNLRRKIEPDPKHPIYLCTVPRHGYVLHVTRAR